MTAKVMVTLNGTANSDYISDDASFDAYTFQVLSSRRKPGCAETAIDRGRMDLLVANDK
jgi:neutral ceramidase